jgi:general secretion pathway protein D
MRAVVICAIPLLLLAGCSPAYLQQRTDEAQNAADVVRGADLRPRFPTAVKTSESTPAQGGGFSLFGASAPAPAAAAFADPAPGAVDSGDGYTLNFDNSPVANVVKVLLGDVLSLNYTLDPRAQGSLTLSSSRPVPKRDLLFVLESALHANNLALIHEAGGYRITPVAEGGAFGPTDSGGAASPGYGTSVVPLQYVSATTLVRLLEGFATRPGTVRADPSGRLLLVVGSGDERRTAIDTVRQFDVDWLRGQSVGLYPVRNGASAAIVSELEKIMDSGEAGLGHGLVKLQDVTAQNAVLVVTARPNMLAAAARWIERLDSPNVAQSSVHVYKVRYGDAKDIAQLLTAMFSSGGGDADSNQLSPGSGTKRLSTTDRLTGGGSQNGSSQSSGGLGGSNSNTGGGLGNSASSPSAQSGGGSSSPFGGLQTAALNSAFAAAGQGGGASVLQGVRITADPADNSLLIYANAEAYRTLERAVQQIDRPKAQVAIDVTIAEVTLNDQLNYGVQFYLANHANLGSVGLTNTGQALASSDSTSGFNIIVGHSATPHLILSALHQLTDVKILSNPSLVVVDNQEATLEVGDQVPVPTGSATVLSANNAIVNTIDYKNTGILLDVIPRVSPDNTIQLDISQEISNVVDSANSASSSASTSGTLTAPTISDRKVKSEITVASGQMVLLAGLVAETQTKSRDGVPVLDQLPLVGGAFGNSGNARNRTELIILIKPQIIQNSVDASRVAEQLRAKMRGGRIDAVNIPNALQINSR